MLFKVKDGLLCQKCTQVKIGYDIKKIKEVVKNKKFKVECISEEYINSVTPLKWRCLNNYCSAVYDKIWASVQRSSNGGCPFCNLNNDRSWFLLDTLRKIFGHNKVKVLKLNVFDDFKKTRYKVFAVPSKKIVVELENWFDTSFFKRYHGNKEMFELQQKSILRKDKVLKEQGFNQIKIPLKKNIHLIDIERQLIQSLKKII